MNDITTRQRQRCNSSACISLEAFIGDSIPAVHYIMPRTVICNKCYALLFKHETQNICCANGKVKLPDWSRPHSYMQQLFINDDTTSKAFFRNIHAYNSLLSLVSLGVQLGQRLLGSEHRGPYCFNTRKSLSSNRIFDSYGR